MCDIKDICVGLIEVCKTRDPFELCNCLDIKIIEVNIGKNILGFFQRINDEYEIIYLNNSISNYRIKEYVCLHELGHVIAHPQLSICFLEKTLFIPNKYEKEADMFAAELMIPDDLDVLDLKGKTSEQISQYLEVPEKLVRLKFENLITR